MKRAPYWSGVRSPESLLSWLPCCIVLGPSACMYSGLFWCGEAMYRVIYSTRCLRVQCETDATACVHSTCSQSTRQDAAVCCNFQNISDITMCSLGVRCYALSSAFKRNSGFCLVRCHACALHHLDCSCCTTYTVVRSFQC